MADFLVSFPGLNIIDLPVNRIAIQFQLFGRDISIYWYGVLIAFAFLIGMLLSMRQAKAYQLDPDHISEMFLLIIPLALVGARLFYVAFAWSEFAENPMRIFDTRTGGLAFYGGVIGGVLGAVIWSRVRKLRLSRIADFMIVYVPLGQAIGRWGNFFNQEAFGTNTSLPWGMISNGTSAYLRQADMPGVSPNLPVHPTFFYEFLANLVIFGILLVVRRHSKKPLTTVAMYLILYGTVRFFVEGIRTDALYVGGSVMRISQLISAAMVASGVFILVFNAWRQKRRLSASLAERDVEETIQIVE